MANIGGRTTPRNEADQKPLELDPAVTGLIEPTGTASSRAAQAVCYRTPNMYARPVGRVRSVTAGGPSFCALRGSRGRLIVIFLCGEGSQRSGASVDIMF
jgi:hypothetical protein